METHNLFTLGEVARMIGVPQYRITYLLAVRPEFEPALRIGNRRMFTANDVEKLRAALTTKEKKMSEVYKTMKQIGAEIGMTSHQVGRRLTALGLRADGKPSLTAHRDHWVERHFAADGENYCWAWDAERTKALLAPTTDTSALTPASKPKNN